jgi:hydrogenase maturation protein HypF
MAPLALAFPPDIAMCDQCRAEFYDPENRRYAYPFITCGNCGPRYTYMKDMPYDREKTTMSDFPFVHNVIVNIMILQIGGIT